MNANETIASLEKRLLEAYKVRHEADEAIKSITTGLQGVALGKAAATESAPPSPAIPGWDANGSET